MVGAGARHLLQKVVVTQRLDQRDRDLVLRQRKRRPEKPFAVMFPSLEALRPACEPTPAEEAVLTSPRFLFVLEFGQSGAGGNAVPLTPMELATRLALYLWRSIPDLGGWTGRNMQYLYLLLAIGVVLMIYARIRGESDYFDRPLEAYDPARAGD